MTEPDSDWVLPLRVAHHPDVLPQAVHGSNPQPQTPTDTDSIDCNNGHFNRVSKEALSSLYAYNQIHGNYCNALILDQVAQAGNLITSMESRFSQLVSQLEGNRGLQEKLVNMHQQAQLRLQRTKEDLLRKQLSLDKSQLQSRTELTATLKQLRHILFRDCELHESPIPRLFIILPKPSGPHHKLTGLRSERFRLHFMCECGTFFLPNKSVTSPQIHVAHSEGYDIIKPIEFIEKYGNHLLAMMYMLKYEAVLASLKASSSTGHKATDKSTKYEGIPGYIGAEFSHLTGNGIGTLADDVIGHVHQVQRRSGSGAGSFTLSELLDNLKPLTRLDLKELRSYLDIKDAGHTLGKMNRMVTSEGHIKWLCVNHYRGICTKLSAKRLRRIIELGSGRFIEELSRIEISLGSGYFARQLYNAMATTHGVQELNVKLEWHASKHDLRLLANAVTQAKLISLTIDAGGLGSYLKRITDFQRYDPIMELAYNGCLQHLCLKEFPGFFSRLCDSGFYLQGKFYEFKSPTKGSIFSLRMFSISDNRHDISNSLMSIINFLKRHQPPLMALELKSDYGIWMLDDVLCFFPKLESFEYDLPNPIASRISKGKILDTTMSIYRLVGLDWNFNRDIVGGGHLTQLTIKYHEDDEGIDRMLNILSQNPGLHTLRIGVRARTACKTVDLVIAARTSVLEEQGICGLRTFEVIPADWSERQDQLDFWEITPENTIRCRLSFAKDSPTFEMVSWINLAVLRYQHDQGEYYDFAETYGWSIVDITSPCISCNYLVTYMDSSIQERGSQLETLDICPLNFDGWGLIGLQSIIKNSPCLTRFHVQLTNMGQEGRVEKAQAVLEQFGERLTELTLRVHSHTLWFPQIASSFPSRLSFPSLESMTLECLDRDTKLRSAEISWIAAMMLARLEELEQFKPFPSPLQELVDNFWAPSTAGEMELKPLRSITLSGFDMSPEMWKRLMEAIDWHTIQNVSFCSSNFDKEQFMLMVDLIPKFTEGATTPRLESIDIRKTNLVGYQGTDPERLELEAMLLALGLCKVPWIQVLCF
ncbi:hypothetical protein BGX31_010466 [Mortierella sp. GBA43]|nr:hypothetical protein BGX31_010466 [Mortierella sp. GBA43]